VPQVPGVSFAPVAVDLDPALVMAVLRHARVIHEGARADPMDEAWFLDRKGAPAEGHFRSYPLERLEPHLEALQGLDDLDMEGADREIHPLHAQFPARMDAMLDPIADDVEMCVDDIEVRIDAERRGEEAAAVRRVAVEEIAVVEIAIGACKGDRLRRLVDREFVAPGQDHQFSPLKTAILPCSRASEQAPRAIDRKLASPRSVRSTKAALNTAVETP
jgi:hypothetical protein